MIVWPQLAACPAVIGLAGVRLSHYGVIMCSCALNLLLLVVYLLNLWFLCLHG